MLDSAAQPTERSGGSAPQRIVRVRRNYNRLVADETLEDFALRFTAKRSRRWTPFQLAMTACGGISFLALEALGGTLTLHYGFAHTLSATLAVAVLIFAAGLPICYYAARFGVDLDLLTRGAGFGYLGSTVTSLIYAAFTFIFFAIEAAIMAVALEMMLGVPLWAGYVACAVVVIPIVARGMAMISRFQIWTQPVWIVLNLAPFVLLAAQGGLPIEEWTRFQGEHSRSGSGFDIVLFGAATTILCALVAQIGEQVDYLRFMPPQTPRNRSAWWAALVTGGPGWIVIGAVKIMAGSLLAVVALRAGFPPEDAEQPPIMYLVAFTQGLPTEALAILATGIFIVVAQMKINVTNAYAGSIAWSNFFSRLTHSHPGRVVWLVFNVAIALLLMEMGVLQALEEILGLYAILAVSWVFALVADLVVNKPLGLSPPHIEFKRAHLYDINPVGFGAMAIGILSALAAHVGLFGQTLSAFPAFVAIAASFCSSPLIAWATGGRYYIARQSHGVAANASALRCVVCDHAFEPEDMASCPAYSGFICSLCCSLEARCRDMCKTDSRVRQQVVGALRARASPRLARFADSPRGHYVTIYLSLLALTGGILALIGFQTSLDRPADTAAITSVIGRIFVVFAIVEGVAAWLFVLAYDSRRVAQEETRRQTDLLQAEIDAHTHTDLQLQREKERAETASRAKTRFLFGMSHELRTPLNSILGFAQILDADANLPEKRRTGVRVIRRSSEHLAGLIDGLLDISRIEAGKLQVYRDNIALGALLTEVSDMFRLQAEGAGIAFSFHADAMLPDHVRGDEKRLRQVLINLLSNAVKFTTEGSVDFTVRYRSQIAEFRVTDTGPGIAAADIERIFEPFERADAGGRIVPGTGLGLTITKLLVEIMGGDIRVSSERGRGSTFVARVMLAATAPPMGEADLGRLTGYAGRKRTVVVVDDEPAHRELLAEFLQPIGFNVIEFESGPACLEAASAAEPDLLVLDVNMPGMDGWRLAGELRVRGVLAPVVMLSADRRPAVPDSRVCDDWVAKPISLPALLASVGRLLDLEWIHEGSGVAAPREDGELERAEFPSEDDRRALADLAAIGFVKGLHAKLDEIAHREPRTQRFVARVRARLECFDLDGCLAILERAGRDR